MNATAGCESEAGNGKRSQDIRLSSNSTFSNSWGKPTILADFSFFLVTGELSTLRQMMKVPNEPGLSPNDGLENAFLTEQSMASNPREGQAKRFGAKTTSPGGKVGQVITSACVSPCRARRPATVTL